MLEEIEDQESGGLNLPYLVGVVRRRHLMFLVPLLAGWLAVWGASWLLPSRYRSSTQILVEQPTMPKDYVTPNVNDDMQDRLQSITQQILSRTRLSHIIEQLKLYPEAQGAADDEKVDRMRHDIEIELVRNGQNDVSAFTVSYLAGDPRTAQRVTSELTNLFISENLESRQHESEDTTKFLEDQLETARKSLADQEEKIRQFKGQHVGELPTQLGSNLQILAGLQSQLQAEEDALNTAKQQRVYLETLVGQYRSMQGPAKSSASGAPTGLAAIDADLDKLRAQLADLSSRYTDRHPDVRKAKEQIAREEKVRDQIIAGMQSTAPSDSDAALEPADPRDPAPVAQLQGQLHANKLEVANRERSTAELKAKISDYQSRLNQEPVREQQLSDLTRGYDQSKANYDDLLKKRNESAMATSMELLQQGERFRVLDPPSLPAKPAYPNRLKFCAIGLAVGLMLGLMVVGALEFFDDRIYDEKELQDLLPVPVMSEIPDMVSPADQEKEIRRMRLGWAAAAAVSFVILAGTTISFLRG
jgi:polysaccharide chain length determinant protein (PEP-CTERM system associated)